MNKLTDGSLSKHNGEGKRRKEIFAFIISIGVILAVSNLYAQDIDLTIIATIESNNNPLAYNYKSQARGLCQITPICLKDYFIYNPQKRTLGYIPETEEEYYLDKLFNPAFNMKVADWYLNKRIPQMLKYFHYQDTLENRLICYNAGIRYIFKDKELPEETINYIEKYKQLTRK